MKIGKSIANKLFTRFDESELFLYVTISKKIDLDTIYTIEELLRNELETQLNTQVYAQILTRLEMEFPNQ